MKRSLWILALSFFILISVLVLNGSGNRVQAKDYAPTVNSFAPEFALKDLQGRPVALKDLVRQNKVTLVNFWATWCPPCRNEIPELNRIYADYLGKSVAVIGVNLQEDRQTLQTFVRENSMKFPVVQDLDGKVANLYRIYYIPDTFLIDRSGKIRRVIQGGTDYETLKKSIEALLKEG